MESKVTGIPPEHEARDAIRQIQEDRGTLARRIARPGRWYNPLVALVAAIVVWAPSTGSVLQFTMIASFCGVGLWNIEYLRDRETGVVLRRPAGRLGWIILIVLSVVFVAMVVASVVLTSSGMPGYGLLTATITFVAMYIGAWLYDRSIRSDLKHES